MPIASLADFKPLADGGGEKVDGTKLSKFGPGGIYHEKQVGALCAVHAMNNLLQGPLFDEWQLREAAVELDRQEKRLLGGSDVDLTGNARGDGFFNVQVISLTLQKMGYSLTPIRGEAGKSIGDTAKENGYICNKAEHWFALRRIGNEWFDLNSCIPTPAHYTNADIHHHINEAKREGYEVFAVQGDFPRTALEDDPKALLAAVQGCGRSGQGYSLFAGRGQTLSGGGGGSSGAAAAAGPASAADMRAARLARLSGGTASTVPTPPEPAPAPTPAPAPAAAPVSPALQQLLDMGFPEDKAKFALDAAGGNAEAAMETLLSM
mmetsp:Transcript_61793/g.108229  ORF Transcript_61793/g.108229 Transcript_61793/m.108229 type:complete len:321 (-) Transcript_61793:72-1034(-)